MTGAPDSRHGPFTTAVLPSISTSAPSRTSSGTCMKRFSKMFSLIARDAVGLRQHGHDLRLHVGREAGERGGLDAQPAEAARAAHAHPVGADLDLEPGLAELVEHDAEVLGRDARHRHVAARDHGRRGEQRARLDPVARPRNDAGPERLVTPCTTRCSGLACSICAPIARSTAISSWTSGSLAAFSISVVPSARHGRHQHVLRPVHGGQVEDHARAAQPRDARLDVAALQLDLRAERRHALQVLVDGRAPIAQPPGSETRA